MSDTARGHMPGAAPFDQDARRFGASLPPSLPTAYLSCPPPCSVGDTPVDVLVLGGRVWVGVRSVLGTGPRRDHEGSLGGSQLSAGPKERLPEPCTPPQPHPPSSPEHMAEDAARAQQKKQ